MCDSVRGWRAAEAGRSSSACVCVHGFHRGSVTGRFVCDQV